MVRAIALAAAVLIGTGSAAFAVDHSTRDAGPRGPIESCCVDAVLLPLLETGIASGARALPDVNQIAPVSEVQTGLDGANWNCRRPDGSLRCFTSLRDQ
jgi:hypothetical protein